MELKDLNELPLYQYSVDEEEDCIVNWIALVDDPAIKSGFICFSDQKKVESSFSINEERQEIIGAAMIPNVAMYRYNELTEDHNCFFSENDIREIAQIYFKNNFQYNLNLDHDRKKRIPAYIFQSYITDDNLGIQQPSSIKEELPNGTWIVGLKVEDKGVFDEIKSGKKGFSIEGNFIMKYIKDQKEKDSIKNVEEVYSTKLLDDLDDLIDKLEKL